MGTKHETSNSQVADGILSDQALRAKEVISQRGHSAKHVRTTCNKSKFGYNGTAKVDSDSLNQTGDVMMNNNIEVIQAQVDSNEKAINVGLAGHKAELEGHKSHVEGNFTAMFAQMEANRKVSETNHQATLDRMDAERKLWEANNKATQARMDADRVASKERMDADRKVSDARFAAAQERMDADRVASKERMDADRNLSDARFAATLERMDVSQRNLEDKIDASATSIKLWGIVTLISVVVAGTGIIATVFAMVRVLSGS